MSISKKLEMANRFVNLNYYVLVFLLLLCFACIACYKLGSPGVQYDELLFINGAQHDKNYSAFIIVRWGDFPILLMPYIGALKSYLYYPIINFFGVTIWSIRLPVILITMATLFILVELLRKVVAKKIALVVLLLLVLDPTLIYMTRLDVGPNVLELFLKCLALTFFYNYFIEKKSLNYLLFGFVFLGLGLFNKLNFLWFINAFYLVIFIVQFGVIRKAINGRNVKQLLPYLALIISYSAYIAYFIFIMNKFNLSDSFRIEDFVMNLEKKYLLIFRMLNGIGFLSYIYPFSGNWLNEFIVYFYGCVILIGIVIVLRFKENDFINKNKKIYFSIIFIILLEIIQIVVTKNATAPWHAFALYPFFTIVFVYSVLFIYNVLCSSGIKLANATMVSLLSLTLLYQGSIVKHYLNNLETRTKNIAWSDKIYELIEYTQKSNKSFVSLDWGLHNTLVVFDNKKDKYYEWCFILNEKYSKELKESDRLEVEAMFQRDSSAVYITHGLNDQVFPNLLEKTRKVAVENGFDLVREKTFMEGDKEIYLLYTLKKRKTEIER